MSKLATSLIPSRTLLPAWFGSEQGRALVMAQRKALQTLVPDQFYNAGMQYGLNEHALLQGLNIDITLYCDQGREPGSESANNVIALPDALPLAANSVDIVLLVHTLDFCQHPHSVLREVAQVMSPEGVLVLTGFHPFSLWGARRYLARRKQPFDARFLSRRVVQDWLALLSFQPLAGRVLNYQPPHLNENWRNRLAWMDKLGDRWWPTLGAVYMLVAQKKAFSGLNVRSSNKLAKLWFPELNPVQARTSKNITSRRRP